LALEDVKRWVHAFKEYPGEHFSTWTQAERLAYEEHSDTTLQFSSEIDQVYGDFHDWELRWRQLHRCYLNELCSTARQWFWRHSACFLEPPKFSRTIDEASYACPVATSFKYLANRMGFVAGSTPAAPTSKEIKSSVLLHLVEPLFAKEQARYLQGQAASIVIRDLAKSNFALVLGSLLEGEALAEPTKYERNWQAGHREFSLQAGTERRTFQLLSGSADMFCARNTHD
jgi:hypothetical protein